MVLRPLARELGKLGFTTRTDDHSSKFLCAPRSRGIRQFEDVEELRRIKLANIEAQSVYTIGEDEWLWNLRVARGKPDGKLACFHTIINNTELNDSVNLQKY